MGVWPAAVWPKKDEGCGTLSPAVPEKLTAHSQGPPRESDLKTYHDIVWSMP